MALNPTIQIFLKMSKRFCMLVESLMRSSGSVITPPLPPPPQLPFLTHLVLSWLKCVFLSLFLGRGGGNLISIERNHHNV